MISRIFKPAIQIRTFRVRPFVRPIDSKILIGGEKMRLNRIFPLLFKPLSVEKNRKPSETGFFPLVRVTRKQYNPHRKKLRESI